MTLPSLAPIPQALATACRRFPLLLLAASVATLAVISFTHSESEVFKGHALRVTLAALFAFPALLASGFAAEWMPRGRWVFQAFALAATVAVWTMLPADKPFPLFFQRWALLVFAAMAVASAVPGLAVSPPGNWWRVNVGILNAVVLAGLFTAVILLGLQLALVSLNALFALQLNHQFYVDVFSVCSLFVAPLAVLALLPPAREALNLDQPGFAVWGRFCQWALLPLGFLYMAILAVYSGVILVHRELPSGMVALPVLVLGVFGMAGLLLSHAWRDHKTWASRYARIFPATFLAFSILLFLSLAERIGAYGFTADRYLSLAAGAWLAMASMFLLVRPSGPIACVPALLALLSLVAALGPFSAANVSLRSQSARLQALLAKHQPGSGEGTRPLSSCLRYLAENHGLSAVEGVIGHLDVPEPATPYDIVKASRAKLSITEVDIDGTQREEFTWPEGKPVPTAQARFVYLQAHTYATTVSLGKTNAGENLSVKVEPRALTAYIGEQKAESFLTHPIDSASALRSETPPCFSWDVAGRHFTIMILNAVWRTPAGSTTSLDSVTWLVLEN